MNNHWLKYKVKLNFYLNPVPRAFSLAWGREKGKGLGNEVAST